MIDDFIKQFFKKYHEISSPQSYNKFLVGWSKTTSAVKKKINITWRNTKSNQFICSSLDGYEEVSNSRSSISDHGEFVLQVNGVCVGALSIETR